MMETPRKTTGQQLGLLGERYAGPIAGCRTGMLFHAVECVTDPLPPAPASPLERKLARKFENCQSGELYESRDL